MIKKKNKKWIWLGAIVILFTNWPAFKNITGLNDWYYMYSNKSGSFTGIENPIEGRLFRKPPGGKFIINSPNQYQCNTIPYSDTIVYRLFTINPIKFWRWGEYIFDWRYRLPYSNWNEIEKKRGFGRLSVSQNCMAF